MENSTKDELLEVPKLHSTTGEYNSYEEAIEDVLKLNNVNTKAITKIVEHIIKLRERVSVLEDQLSKLANK